MKMSTKGFTLLELAMTLLIMAIAAAAMALRAGGPMATAQKQDVVARVVYFDRLSRLQARESGHPMVLTVDCWRSSISRSDAEQRKLVGQLDLPDGYLIGAVRVADADSEAARTGIVISNEGFSRSYALLIEHPGHWRQWVLICGLTGQAVYPQDDKQIDDIFAETNR